MKQRILLSGGTGFLGRYLVAAFCQAGYAQRVLTRRPEAHPWLAQYPELEVIQGDLRDPSGVQKAAEGCDYVIHAAALFSMWGEASAFYDHNVEGTRNILRAAQATGVHRFVYVSTVAVIGNPESGAIIDESYPANPADAYQQSKLDAEQLVHEMYAAGLSTIILRPGAFYGPLGEYAFNRLFFRDPMRGIIMQMDGGRHIIFPAYVLDVAQATVAALTMGRVGETYNLCGDCLSHREAFDIVCREARIRYPRLNLPGFVGLNASRLLTWIAKFTQKEPFWPLNLQSYVFNDWNVSSAKAVRELGFAPTTFEEGARRTIAWYREGCPAWIPELACAP